MHLIRTIRIVALVSLVALAAVGPASALYVPNNLRVKPFTDAHNADASTSFTLSPTNPMTASTAMGYNVSPIPDPFVIDETKTAALADGFNNITHLMRFVTDGETSNFQKFGHSFLRNEAWDIAFDVKLETPHGDVNRKEFGFGFESGPGGSGEGDIFYAASNSGHHSPGPGEIQVQPGYPMLPDFAFSASGQSADYNQNGTVDAADYVIWRQTLGSITDFRANGDRTGASALVIDQADYDFWRTNFGQMITTTSYTVGDTLNMRMIYTPPIVDPMNPDPLTNVTTAGKAEFKIRLNGGAAITSGPLDFDNPYKGIPDHTLISARAQSLYTTIPDPDGAKYTFSHWDFNGDLPGSGLGAGADSVAAAPEPSSAVLALVGVLLAGAWRRRGRQCG